MFPSHYRPPCVAGVDKHRVGGRSKQWHPFDFRPFLYSGYFTPIITISRAYLVLGYFCWWFKQISRENTWKYRTKGRCPLVVNVIRNPSKPHTPLIPPVGYVGANYRIKSLKRSVEPQKTKQNKTALLSVEFWLFNRDPSPYKLPSISSLIYPKITRDP